MNDPYQELANSIILLAVKDYREARHKLHKRPKNKTAKATLEECEEFFLSDWFKTLTTLDGEMLLQKLRQEEIK